MLKAVVDTNVVIAGVIATWLNSASASILRALRSGEFRLFQSDQKSLAELKRILHETAECMKPRWPEKEVEALYLFVARRSRVIQANAMTSPSLTRDASDTKFLDLALAADADYLVTYDHRHLLRLKKIGRTKIVTPDKFMRALTRSQ